jgi:hypothetical protein
MRGGLLRAAATWPRTQALRWDAAARCLHAIQQEDVMRAWPKTAWTATVCAMAIACGTESAREQVEHGAAGKASTLTGCLTRGDNGRSLVLRAENEPQLQGNERPERPLSSPNVYRLEAADRTIEMERHVDSRVRVNGSLETVPVHASGDANGTIQPAPTSGANTTPQDARTDMIDLKMFRVVSIEALGGCAP